VNIGDTVRIEGSARRIATIVEVKPGDMFVIRHDMGRELIHKSLLMVVDNSG
jgi:hypothetical protein